MSKAPKKDDVAVGALRIVYQDAPKELEELIVTSATNALKALYKGEKSHFTEVAQHIKKEIEDVEAGAWHVIVGKSFGSFVSHEVKKQDALFLRGPNWLPGLPTWLTDRYEQCAVVHTSRSSFAFD